MKIDQILFNGVVYTVNKNAPWAEAVAISGNKIAAVGTSGEIVKMQSQNTVMTDLQGKMVLPGFIDSHAHPSWGGIELLYKVDLFNCQSQDEYIQRISHFIDTHQDISFVQGVGWVNPHFPEEGPSCKLLDEITGDIPMAFDSADHHSIWANTKAMEMAGIDKDSKCAEGGVIEKDDKGQPSGTFRESAQDLIKAVIPSYTTEEYKNGILKYQEVMAAYGITMSHDAMVDGGGPAHLALMQLDQEERLLFKMAASFTTYADKYLKEKDKYKQYQQMSQGTMFRANHVKFFVDGVVEASTAYLKKPYANNLDYCGESLWKQEELNELTAIVDGAGLTPHFHVIGDKAIDQMLCALEYTTEKNGEKERRPLAAHVQILDLQDLPRMKKQQVMVSANPYWFVKEPGYYYRLELPYLGEERASGEYPMKTLFDEGLTVASASDFSVTPMPKPLRGIQMGMTRCFPEMNANDPDCVLGEEERVSLEQMIQSFTINGAKTLFAETVTGSIEAGKLADLVVLEKNLFDVPASEIAFVKVMTTISEGKTIYRA